MRTPGEVFGLMAYLFVMYGGFPDREVIDAAYDHALGEDPAPLSARGRLHVVPRTKPSSAESARAEHAA